MEASQDLIQITPDRPVVPGHYSLFSEYDIQLFRAGKHFHLYLKLGAHLVTRDGVAGVYFAVWAPNARRVSVVGDFNGWNRDEHRLDCRWDHSGIWEGFFPGIANGALYKYFIESHEGFQVEKGDPYARCWETPPATASVVWQSSFKWTDKKWLNERQKEHPLQKPLSIYEVHLGSWRRGDNNRFLTYRELAKELPAYCQDMGFTHVELMPVMEHPFYGSWGYQITGYFAPSSRFGTPDDFRFLVNELHRAGIGVILDWVPSHFPGDEHGLIYFDGTHLYEHPDPKKGFHPDWNSYIFNYGRNEVRAFLISNALYWLDQFHIDGLRVDAVASMLYLDYSRQHGGWEPNAYGGREHLEAISFLRECNDAIHQFHPDTITIAEESTAFPGVSHPTATGGLGFDGKWMMGWMHDALAYFGKDPMYRSWHQGQMAFSIVYAFSERFFLPLSHDEVVYGKRSLLQKMPGNDWQKLANLRLLFGYMFGHPGAKLLFMGGEFGQDHEWRHDFGLDWHEANEPGKSGLQSLLKALNQLYRTQPALYEQQFSGEGFEWIDFQDSHNSVLAWMRKGKGATPSLIFIAHFTPTVLHHYRIGVPERGTYQEILNTDHTDFGGSGCINESVRQSAPIPKHGRPFSISVTLSPLGVTVLQLAAPTKLWY